MQLAEKWIFVDVSVQDATITNQVLYLTELGKWPKQGKNTPN